MNSQKRIQNKGIMLSWMAEPNVPYGWIVIIEYGGMMAGGQGCRFGVGRNFGWSRSW
jgi:hypothetical protein